MRVFFYPAYSVYLNKTINPNKYTIKLVTIFYSESLHPTIVKLTKIL